MNNHQGRYEIREPLVSETRYELCSGTDLSLKRDILLYIKEQSSVTDVQAYLRRLGSASAYSDERFMKIFDVTLDERKIYAILNAYSGRPLRQQLSQWFVTVDSMLSIVIDLSKAVLDALEAGIQHYSVTADNIWVSKEDRLLIVNYWEEAEGRQQGAAGLAILLYQLLTKTTDVPERFETMEFQLRGHLQTKGLSASQCGHLIQLLQRAYNGLESVSSFLIALHWLKDSLRSASEQGQELAPRATRYKAAPVKRKPEDDEPVAEFDEEAELEQDEEESLPSRWNVKRLAIISLVCLCVFAAAAVGVKKALTPPANEQALEARQNGAPAERSPAGESSPDDEGLAQGKEEQPEPASSGSADSGEQPDSASEESESAAGSGENVDVPSLKGMTVEEAHKRLLDDGLRYQYFIVASDEPEGLVFQQEPEAGTTGRKGDSITFYVSRGNGSE